MPAERRRRPTQPRRSPANRGKRYPVEVLTREEVQQLLHGCSPKAPTGIRNRALLVVLYRGMLRLAEALALKPKDLDRKAGTVRVLAGKGQKARTIGLDPEAFARWSGGWTHARSGASKPALPCSARWRAAPSPSRTSALSCTGWLARQGS